MTSQGRPYSRFRRALATGNETLVLAAAAELEHVSLADALAVVLVLGRTSSRHAERAAVRWASRFCAEVRPAPAPAEAQLVLGAAVSLTAACAPAGVEALHSLSEQRGLRELMRVLDEWEAGPKP